MKFYNESLEVQNVRALNDHILVTDMQFDQRQLASGIVLLNDDMKSVGIRPRWAKVYKVGPEQHDVHENQYVLVAHGRWTRGVRIKDKGGEKTLRRVDPNDILLISDEPVFDETVSDKEV